VAVQIPLYDDEVLWVVPRSHRQPDTGAILDALLVDPCAPLPGAEPTQLRAGDGVVYSNLILHWGSNYGPNPYRRTLHWGYRSFGGGQMPYAHGEGPGDFSQLLALPALPADAQAHFEAGLALRARERAMISSAFRAAAVRDGAAFVRAVVGLHPGSECRITAVILLAKLAQQLVELRQPELSCLPEAERFTRVGARAADKTLFCQRFSGCYERTDLFAPRQARDKQTQG
jgi:hypothetical protein